MRIRKIDKQKNGLGRFLFLTLLALFFSVSVQAQVGVVQGTVLGSDDGMPIPGVTVIVKGQSKGTATDFDGKYTIKAKDGDLLVFSYLGMTTKNVNVKGGVVNVKLNPSTQNLDEVVVIGYGAVKKKEITGAVSQLKAEDLESIVTPDLGSAIQGQVSGVNVVSSSTPGGASEILIRGITSLQDNTPLYVVDGIVQNGDPRIPPSDIETINILKDAASTAIYGVRGATGVILITTKQGKAGTLQVRVNGSYSINSRKAAVPLMNSVEQTYFDIVTQRTVNGIYDNQVGLDIFQNPISFQNETDLNKLIFRENTPTQNYDANISGGSKEITYNVSLGLYNEEGLQINSGYNRFNVRANTVYEKNKLRIQTSVGLNTDKRDIPQNFLLSQAVVYRPTQNGIRLDSFDELGQDGDNVLRLGWVLESLRTTNILKTTRANASVNLNYKLNKEIQFSSNIGFSSANEIGKTVRPYQEIKNSRTGALLSVPEQSYVENRTRFTNNLLGEFGLTYATKINDDHNLTLTLFGTGEKNQSEAFSARRNGAIDPNGQVLDLAVGTQSVSSGFDYTDTRIGMIGRLQYDYKGRYVLSSSIRRDGSSKFPTDKNWAVFPSAAFAWNISDEKFWSSMKNTVNNFKLRLSQGTVGVDRAQSYAAQFGVLPNINYINSSGSVLYGTIQQNYANPLLSWESTTQSNIGIDLAFFKNRLTVTAERYDSDKKDMLFPVYVPPSGGAVNNARVVLNAGNMTNQGYELAVGFRGRIGKFNYNMNGTFSTNTNVITKINQDTEFLFTDDYGLVSRAPDQSRITALAVGHEAGAFYLWRTNGIIDTEEKLAEYQKIDNNARLGDTRFIDQDGNNILDDKDRVYSGSGLPKYEIGYTLNTNWKSFDFSMNLYAALGQEVMNGFDAWAYGFGRHKDQIYQWSDANPVSPIPTFRNDIRRHRNYTGYSDLWLEDGSYLRIRQISLGYSIPKKTTEKWGLNRLRFYTRVQNPFTFTKYSGYNPEIGGGVAGKGLDKETGPISIQYMLGVNLAF
ncbi:SusC/RagA family TonB-linked outer membrane protein [Flavobacterium sp.]|uniref:SusC/RagA family TonB-linked outer membrane protein n=1 Tax=Flavobacterium sp. TaxID=239 RepID=UPI003C3575A5